MSYQKRGGSMQYDWLGPEQPVGTARYTVGGRSVSAIDASSGVSMGTASVSRRAIATGVKNQPLTIKPR